jgi:hypothetical protein
MDWQPIETAPKGKLRRILIARDGRVEIAHWAVMIDEFDGRTLGGEHVLLRIPKGTEAC